MGKLGSEYMSSIAAALLRLALAFGLMVSAAQADDFALSCYYSAADNDEGLAEYAHCARRDGDTLRVAPEHLRHLSFAEEGLASLAADGAMYYVNQQGASLQVPIFDNGADYFAEGLVRGLVKGKLGYYDKHFNQVIAPKYDWGTPFDGGKAEVCVGCTRGPADADGHWSMGGGRWGVIDRTGKEVQPLR